MKRSSIVVGSVLLAAYLVSFTCMDKWSGRVQRGQFLDQQEVLFVDNGARDGVLEITYALYMPPQQVVDRVCAEVVGEYQLVVRDSYTDVQTAEGSISVYDVVGSVVPAALTVRSVPQGCTTLVTVLTSGTVSEKVQRFLHNSRWGSPNDKLRRIMRGLEQP